jgi:hypothetical protein
MIGGDNLPGTNRGSARAFGLLFGLGLASCYNPKVTPGGLQCAAPPAKACPDDFECRTDLNVCVRPGAGGSGGNMMTGSGGVSGSGGNGTGGSSPDAGRVHLLGEACTIFNRGSANQSDDCDPTTNLVCVDDACGGSKCFRNCTADSDCPTSACTRAAPNGAGRLCELPFVACNPQDGHAGCPNAALGCFLLSSDQSPQGGDRTVCDCSVASGSVNSPCTEVRDCFPGLVCPALGNGPAIDTCQRVCNPTAAVTGCSNGETCHPYGATWGYCFL